MTQLLREKTSQAVADHILGLLFDGRLRGGDRIDLDEIASSLGVSRVPVREGLMHLERDGLVRLPHYRGAFVAPFDAGTIREAFDLYGLLSALTSRRAAVRNDPEMVESLTKLDDRLAACNDVDEFEQVAREFRRVVNLTTAGPHLRALLRSFGGLVPAAARFSIEDALPAERSALRAEFDALRAGDPEAAAARTLAHVQLSADNAIAALRRRGVLGPAGEDAGNATESLAARAGLLRLLDKADEGDDR
jgi:DNA-binding GntR family transcriptional regulator